jgi:hypothetical protein
MPRYLAVFTLPSGRLSGALTWSSPGVEAHDAQEVHGARFLAARFDLQFDTRHDFRVHPPHRCDGKRRHVVVDGAAPVLSFRGAVAAVGLGGRVPDSEGEAEIPSLALRRLLGGRLRGGEGEQHDRRGGC